MHDAGALVREFGSFGLIAVLVIYGIRHLPRCMVALESIARTVERLEEKIDAGRKP